MSGFIVIFVTLGGLLSASIIAASNGRLPVNGPVTVEAPPYGANAATAWAKGRDDLPYRQAALALLRAHALAVSDSRAAGFAIGGFTPPYPDWMVPGGLSHCRAAAGVISSLSETQGASPARLAYALWRQSHGGNGIGHTSGAVAMGFYLANYTLASFLPCAPEDNAAFIITLFDGGS